MLRGGYVFFFLSSPSQLAKVGTWHMDVVITRQLWLFSLSPPTPSPTLQPTEFGVYLRFVLCCFRQRDDKNSAMIETKILLG